MQSIALTPQKAYIYKHTKIKVIILPCANTRGKLGLILSLYGKYVFENKYFLHTSSVSSLVLYIYSR